MSKTLIRPELAVRGEVNHGKRLVRHLALKRGERELSVDEFFGREKRGDGLHFCRHALELRITLNPFGNAADQGPDLSTLGIRSADQ
jgi:hypothetical protein